MDESTKRRCLYQALNAIEGLQKGGKPDEDGIQGYIINEGWDLHELFVMLDVLAGAYRSAQRRIQELEEQLADTPAAAPDPQPEKIADIPHVSVQLSGAAEPLKIKIPTAKPIGKGRAHPSGGLFGKKEKKKKRPFGLFSS